MQHYIHYYHSGALEVKPVAPGCKEALTGSKEELEGILDLCCDYSAALGIHYIHGFREAAMLKKAERIANRYKCIITMFLAIQNACRFYKTSFGMAQGLPLGALRKEDLVQIEERLPGLLQESAKASGVDPARFRKMIYDGEVTSQCFKDTLIKVNPLKVNVSIDRS
ncbi:MAG: tape measure protein [Kangiella sp.]|nr:tape measure protein [Kangiella sp.]MCW9029232.1 tape measure protein [Kangiella sp.]